MAKCLVRAGYQVQGFDLSQDACNALLEAGGKICEDARLAAEGAEAVITMLPNSKIVNKVVLDSLAYHLGNAVLIDMSSSVPAETRKLGEELEKRGLNMVDAPVSGGIRRAVDGSLAIMIGGDPASVARVKPVLEALGRSIFETGPLGSGHAMKALNNFVSAAGLWGAALEQLQDGADHTEINRYLETLQE